jgi:transmembrane sensor
MNELGKNIIFQYFSGTASPLQKKLILEWLQEKGNQELFYQWLEDWEKEHIQYIPDLASASQKLTDRLDNHAGINESDRPADRSYVQRHLPSFRKMRWIAASVVIILAVAGFFIRGIPGHIRYRTAFGEVREFILSDGSHVVLNANSSLLVPRWGFEKGKREVELTGEAAFIVKHTPSIQPFIVTTRGQLNVEVLGTEFSVYSRDNSNRVELKNGSVKLLFKQQDQQPLIMKPGDIANINVAGRLSVRHQQPENSLMTWKDHRFVFDSTSLVDAVRRIHEFFGNKIIIDDGLLQEKRISGSFKAETSEELLSILAELYHIQMLVKKDSIILTGIRH